MLQRVKMWDRWELEMDFACHIARRNQPTDHRRVILIFQDFAHYTEGTPHSSPGAHHMSPNCHPFRSHNFDVVAAQEASSRDPLVRPIIFGFEDERQATCHMTQKEHYIPLIISSIRFLIVY